MINQDNTAQTQFNDVEPAKLLMVTGETFSFFGNSDQTEVSATFGNWVMSLYYSDGNGKVGALAYYNIGTVEQVIVDPPDDFRFYSTFTVPSDLPLGKCFYLVIIDEGDNDNVKFVSDEIKTTSLTQYTIPIKYRNSVDILNYSYEALPSFYNQFRISCVRRAPNYPVVKSGYPLTSGAFLTARSTQGKTDEFVTGWFDDSMHEGFTSASIHGDLQFFVQGQFRNYERSEDSSYELEWLENYPAAEAVIRLQRKDTFSSSKTR